MNRDYLDLPNLASTSLFGRYIYLCELKYDRLT